MSAGAADELLAATAAQRRFAMILFEAFALVALLLAATGMYGVLSGGVTERTREIGIRAALGASRRDILALVVRQGMTLTGLGVAIGLGCSPIRVGGVHFTVEARFAAPLRRSFRLAGGFGCIP